MADVQKQFEEFHEKIRVDYETLREKRDIVLNRLGKHLKENKRPGFDEILQGSYAMGMGIAPIDELEYDMDVGLRFQISDRDHAVLMQENRNVFGVAADGFIEGVVKDFDDEMVEAFFVGATDKHARSFPDRLQTLEDGNIFGGIFGLRHKRGSF